METAAPFSHSALLCVARCPLVHRLITRTFKQRTHNLRRRVARDAVEKKKTLSFRFSADLLKTLLFSIFLHHRHHQQPTDEGVVVVWSICCGGRLDSMSGCRQLREPGRSLAGSIGWPSTALTRSLARSAFSCRRHNA